MVIPEAPPSSLLIGQQAREGAEQAVARHTAPRIGPVLPQVRSSVRAHKVRRAELSFPCLKPPGGLPGKEVLLEVECPLWGANEPGGEGGGGRACKFISAYVTACGNARKWVGIEGVRNDMGEKRVQGFVGKRGPRCEETHMPMEKGGTNAL